MSLEPSLPALVRGLVRRLVAGLALCPALLGAQTLTGTATRAEDGTPVAGAIIVVRALDSDSVLANAVTGARGQFSVVIGREQIRVQALRIGQRPFDFGPVRLVTPPVPIAIVLPHEPIPLASMRTTASRPCEIGPEAGADIVTLLEESRKTLLASQLSPSEGRATAQVRLFRELRSIDGERITVLEESQRAGETAQPFRSLSADSLARVGYVTDERDGVVYRAPDAEVLLSDSFLARHCYRAVAGTGANAAWVGLAFEPSQHVDNFVDVRGTLWLDRSTGALRQIHFLYDTLPRALRRADLGGTIEFTHLDDGLVFISRWEIRMPRVTIERGVDLSGTRIGQQTRRLRLTGVQASGGEVVQMRQGDDLLFVGSSRAVDVDATSLAAAVAASGMTMESDTIATASTCTDVSGGEPTALVYGTVLRGDQRRVADAVVRAEWKQEFRQTGAFGWTWKTKQQSAFTASDGFFELCGIPRDRPVTIRAQLGDRRTRPLGVRVPALDGRLRVDLRFTTSAEETAPRGALRIAVRDAANHPIPFATITLNGGAIRVTNADGDLIVPNAPDSLAVSVRRIGYAAFDGKLARSDSAASQPQTIVLLPIAQRLATVSVNARGTSPLESRGFYDRVLRAQRGAFVAEFLTPEVLDTRNVARLSDMLVGRRYVAISRNPAGVRYAIGRAGCPMLVLLDGQVVQPEPGRGVAIDEIASATTIAAIEIYASTANAPAELVPLTGPNANGQGSCGIVALWTGSRE